MRSVCGWEVAVERMRKRDAGPLPLFQNTLEGGITPCETYVEGAEALLEGGLNEK